MLSICTDACQLLTYLLGWLCASKCVQASETRLRQLYCYGLKIAQGRFHGVAPATDGATNWSSPSVLTQIGSFHVPILSYFFQVTQPEKSVRFSFIDDVCLNESFQFGINYITEKNLDLYSYSILSKFQITVNSTSINRALILTIYATNFNSIHKRETTTTDNIWSQAFRQSAFVYICVRWVHVAVI